MKFTFFIILFFVFFLSSSTNVHSQDTLKSNVMLIGGGFQIDYQNPKEYEIGPIRVEGADNFDHQVIKLLAGLRQGQRILLPGPKVTEAIRNLWKEGLFSSIEINAEKEIQGVVYFVIKLSPRPKLSRFKFDGVTRKDADKLREIIGLFSGKTISENLMMNTQHKVKGYYREKGYYGVKVKITQEPDKLMNNASIFIISVDRGKKVGIGEIIIEGNTTLSTMKVKRAMKDTKEKALWRVFKRSKFTSTAYEKDKQALIEKFNSVGLRDARILKDTVYQLDEKNLVIKMSIDEGKVYHFGSIEWIGNTKFSSGYLDTILGIKKGDIYNKSILDSRITMSQDGRDISSLYMDRGYLFFQVIPIETNVENNEISYQMRIIEGKEARVKRIIIKGNTKTNEHVIRREIRTKPGDLFNRNDIIRTQRELSQ